MKYWQFSIKISKDGKDLKCKFASGSDFSQLFFKYLFYCISWVHFQSFNVSFSSNIWLKSKNDNRINGIYLKWIVYLQLTPALFAPSGVPPKAQFQYAGSTSALTWMRQFISKFSLNFYFHLTTGPTASKARKWNWGRRDGGEAVTYYISLWIIYLSPWLCQSLRWDAQCCFLFGGDALTETGRFYCLRFNMATRQSQC